MSTRVRVSVCVCVCVRARVHVCQYEREELCNRDADLTQLPISLYQPVAFIGLIRKSH